MDARRSRVGTTGQEVPHRVEEQVTVALEMHAMAAARERHDLRATRSQTHPRRESLEVLRGADRVSLTSDEQRWGLQLSEVVREYPAAGLR